MSRASGSVEHSFNSVPRTALALGWSGLVPFCALPLFMAWWPEQATLTGAILGYYALGILCFLLGSWWGIGLMRQEAGVLLYSNLLFLVLLGARVVLQDPSFMLAAAVLFLVILVGERRLSAFRRQPRYYAKMRAQLSLTAAISLLLGGQLLH